MAAASDEASTNTPHTETEAIGARLCSVLVALLNKCVNADRGAFLCKFTSASVSQAAVYIVM